MLRHHWRRTNDLYYIWSVNCALLAEFDETLLEKEEEITQLRGQLAGSKQEADMLLPMWATEQAWSLMRIPALLYKVQQSQPKFAMLLLETIKYLELVTFLNNGGNSCSTTSL